MRYAVNIAIYDTMYRAITTQEYLFYVYKFDLIFMRYMTVLQYISKFNFIFWLFCQLFKNVICLLYLRARESVHIYGLLWWR